MAVQNEENGVVWGSSGALKVIGNVTRIFFLILDLKMAICGAFLVQFFAVQLKI